MPSRDRRDVPRREAIADWLFTTNSTRTGVVWLAATFLFFVFGGYYALQMRGELIAPGETIMGPDRYAQLFSLHGTFMAFFFAVPVFFGFASIVVPRALGVTNVAFPRLNSLDLWLILVGALTLEVGYFLGQRPEAGWTSYVPLSLEPYLQGLGEDWWVWGIFMETFGTLLASINFIATILHKRPPTMLLRRMPIFVWSMLLTSILVIVAAPFLLTALSLLFLDRNFGTAFYDPTSLRAVLMWQDLFWFYSHPATYVMLLPAFGIVSAILARFSGRPLFSYGLIVLGSVGVTLFSFFLWWHHMFTTTIDMRAQAFASFNTMAVSVFSGIVVFTWLASLWRGRIRFTTPMLFALGIILMFTVGGANGVFMGYVPLDWYLHDTYWLVAHFHYIIFGSTVLGTLAAIYYWFPLALHRQLDERLGKWHFWLTIVGMNLAFFPMHFLGMDGMRRRVWDYDPSLTGWNVVITVGAFVIAAATLLFLANIALTLWRGQHVGDEVWGPTTIGPAGATPADAEPEASERPEGA